VSEPTFLGLPIVCNDFTTCRRHLVQTVSQRPKERQQKVKGPRERTTARDARKAELVTQTTTQRRMSDNDDPMRTNIERCFL
jgi:hypothetical protein